MTVNQIIQGCKEGKRQCQKLLVQMYAPGLLSVCNRYIKSPDEAYDVLQESLIMIFNKLETYRQEGSFEGWMRTITVNTSLQWLRKHQRQISFSDLKEVDHNNENISLHVIPDILGQINVNDIHRLLKHLPPSLYLVFNLYVVEGYSHKDIAAQLDITESTSRAALSKARAKLIDMCANAPHIAELFNIHYTMTNHLK